MTERSIVLKEGWLHFPINRSAQRRYIHLEAEGKPFIYLYIHLSDEPEFYGGMELTRLTGKEVRLVLEDDEAGALLCGIREGGPMAAANPLYPNLYHEKHRPQYHFSSRRGWINDPNGLIYDGENYHLYYQHNPYGVIQGSTHMHWGHAVSPDGVRWTERSDAIRPWTSTCQIASGSSIIDHDGMAGYGKNTIIAAFTHFFTRNFRLPSGPWSRAQGQFFAYSTDGGDSFTCFPDNPVVPTQDGKGWRDPRLFRHPDGGFGLVVYEFEKEQQNEWFSFYRSNDLHHWTCVSQIKGMFECPDLFQLTPINGGEARWVLCEANGAYCIGDFVNGSFQQESEFLPLDYGASIYGGQTWNGRDDSDGRMHIGWLRDDDLCWNENTPYSGEGFSQCMTVSCLLTLVRTADGYRVDRNPNPALAELRTENQITVAQRRVRHAVILLYGCGDTILTIDAAEPVTIRVCNAAFIYHPESGRLQFCQRPVFAQEEAKRLNLRDEEYTEATLRQPGKLQLRILTDKLSCEFFFQGELSASYGIAAEDKTIELSSQAEFTMEGASWEMARIWP